MPTVIIGGTVPAGASFAGSAAVFPPMPGGQIRPLSPPAQWNSLSFSAALSPDGASLSYTLANPTAAAVSLPAVGLLVE